MLPSDKSTTTCTAYFGSHNCANTPTDRRIFKERNEKININNTTDKSDVRNIQIVCTKMF